MYKGIILFGPPGVGKGSEGKLLGEMPSYFHFSTGDMFRNLDRNNRLGSKVGLIIDQGNFIDDTLTLELTRQTIMQHRAHGRYHSNQQYLLLDGLPRNLAQVSMVKKFVDVQQVINLYVPDEEILVQRLANRATIEGRADDAKEDIVRSKIAKYHADTKPMLELYDSKKIVNINGSGSIQEVHQSVLEQILRK